MAMARGILDFPEDCLRNVCMFISDKHERRDVYMADSNSLLSLATTCRDLYDPAMSVLWCVLHTIVPLFYTLPADLCILEHQKDEGKLENSGEDKQRAVLRFSRVPIPEDFVQWKKYSALVRQIRYQSSTESPYSSSLPTVSRDTLSLLALYGPRPLAPRLKSLLFEDCYFQRCTNYTMRFFSTTLTHLWLTLVNPTYDFPVYVGYFAKHAPNLQVLVLDCNPQAQPLMKCVSFSQFGLLELVHLRELRIPDIETSTSAIAELGALPRLQGLSLSVETSFRKPRGHLPVFRALKQLHLNTCHFAVAATVLEAVFAPYLEVFRVNCALPVVRHYEESSRVSDEDLQQVFTAVAEHPSYDTLRQLSFFISPLQLPRNMSDFIPPLLKLPALTKLEIIGFTAITVDDATLDAMSRAWPNLECLNLCQAVLYQYKTVVRDGREVRVADEEEGPDVQVRSLWVEPKATLHGLVPLALRCPRLHTINLAIDSSKGTPDAQVTHSSVPPSSAMLRLGRDMDPDRVFHRSPSPEPRLPYVLPENSALTRLYVGMFSGPPRNPEKAATLLSAIFPHLHDVSRSFEEEGDWPEIVQGWVHFDVLLRHFHVIRFQEQTWRRKLAVASTSASPT